MSAARDLHGPEHSELVLAYSLQILAPRERDLAETNLSACAQCRQELKALRPVVDALVSWPADLLRPLASLWDRVAERIAADGDPPPTGLAGQPWTEPEWKEVAPGISVKMLAVDAEKNRVSMLVRLAPGAHYPPHRHAGVEELHVVYGELVIDDKKLVAGDYLRSEAGSTDQLVWSPTGCTCFLTTSSRDELG
jgi:quercetin dioxygenase-like cupin family protein